MNIERLRRSAQAVKGSVRGSLRWAYDQWMTIEQGQRYMIAGALMGTVGALVSNASFSMNLAWIGGGVFVGYEAVRESSNSKS